jgi:hypothetical protein
MITPTGVSSQTFRPAAAPYFLALGVLNRHLVRLELIGILVRRWRLRMPLRRASRNTQRQRAKRVHQKLLSIRRGDGSMSAFTGVGGG